jgi:type II secretory pathway component GspD/PulD (secretin)
MQVSQTDNSASNEVEFDAPVINKREATTQIFIRDGQTTVIGGLAGKSTSSDISGIPILSRIPIIGHLLFGNITKSEDVTELFLFLTPHIISSDEDIDKLREAVKNGSDLLKDIDVGPRIVPSADTLSGPLKPLVKPDTMRKIDSATTRRRPPAGRDSSDTKIPIQLRQTPPQPANREPWQ